MDSEYWTAFLNNVTDHLASSLPLILAMAAMAIAIGFSPFGRALVAFLREQKRDTALTEGILDELVELRRTLGEVTERLDATEQLLVQARQTPLASGLVPPRPVDAGDSGRVPTPH